MPLLDKITDLAGKFAPSKSSKLMAGGIGSGHGMVPIDDDVSDCLCIRSHSLTLPADNGGSIRTVRLSYVILRCCFLLHSRHGWGKRRAAPISSHNSCVMGDMALGSFLSFFWPLCPPLFKLIDLIPTFLDDRVKTNHHHTYIPNILQLHRNGMFCRRS